MLKGGAVFLADLVRAVDLPLEVSFMAISRYGDAEESLGRVQILLDVELDLAGRDVLLVEDIVDTGLTSRYLLSVLRSRGAHSVELCTLLDKTVRRIVPCTRGTPGSSAPTASSSGTAWTSRSGTGTSPTSCRWTTSPRCAWTPTRSRPVRRLPRDLAHSQGCPTSGPWLPWRAVR